MRVRIEMRRVLRNRFQWQKKSLPHGTREMSKISRTLWRIRVRGILETPGVRQQEQKYESFVLDRIVGRRRRVLRSHRRNCESAERPNDFRCVFGVDGSLVWPVVAGVQSGLLAPPRLHVRAKKQVHESDHLRRTKSVSTNKYEKTTRVSEKPIVEVG